MSTTKLPTWLLGINIFGAEGEGGSNNPPANEDPAEDPDDEDIPGTEELAEDHPLKVALRKERKANRDTARELRRLQREQEAIKKAEADRELAEKSQLEQASTKLKNAEDRLTRLASGYLRSSLDRAIEQAAREANFIDPNDAISSIERDSITFEQDSDDPSRVTIDMKSVKAAVKALAESKKHWIATGTSDSGATGSKFDGSAKRGKKTNEDQLAELYPALRH